jgi:hypothetical protein
MTLAQWLASERAAIGAALRRNAPVTELSFDPEGVIEVPVPLAAAGAASMAKKAGSKIKGAAKRLFGKRNRNRLKRAAKSIAGAVSEHSQEITDAGMALIGGGQSMPGGSPVMSGPVMPGTAHGHWTKAHGHVPSHWSPRRRPRMNPGNTRAMRRAIRRVTSGARLYSHLFHMAHKTVPGAPHVKIKRHRKGGRFA